jgi:hypothetical protein
VTRVRVFQEVHEAEHLRIVAAENCPTSIQDLKPWGRENWSNGKHLACASQKGGFVELEVDVPQAGRYQLDVRLTRSSDYGRVEASLDGRRVGPGFDGYSEALAPSVKVTYGTFELTEGPHRLRFTAVDRNPKSADYKMGMDCVRLTPVGPAP